MKDDRVYLTHIVECIQHIQEYTQSGRDVFMKSSLIQDAVIRNFEIIGEAVKQVSQKIKDNRPEIPWRRIGGFRDVLIHEYFNVDLNEVWNVIEYHLAHFKSELLAILKKIEKPSAAAREKKSTVKSGLPKKGSKKRKS